VDMGSFANIVEAPDATIFSPNYDEWVFMYIIGPTEPFGGGGWCLVGASMNSAHRKGHKINLKTLVTTCLKQSCVFKVMLNRFNIVPLKWLQPSPYPHGAKTWQQNQYQFWYFSLSYIILCLIRTALFWCQY
jgi:hypothetical protein